MLKHTTLYPWLLDPLGFHQSYKRKPSHTVAQFVKRQTGVIRVDSSSLGTSVSYGHLSQEKKHLKMSSVEVVCCKYIPSITDDELIIEANSVDPEQTAPIWVHTVCHRGFLNISTDEKSRLLLLRLAH